MSRALDQVGCGPVECIDIDETKLGDTVHGQKVVPPPTDNAALQSDFILVTVGAHGARAEIRAYLTERGFTELDDFVCVA